MQPVSMSYIFKFHSQFCSVPLKTVLSMYTIVAQNNYFHDQHLHTVYLNYSSFIVLWSNFPQNMWFDSIITGLPRPVMSSYSTFPLHNFFRILLLMALLFSEQTLYNQNHKTTNNWRKTKPNHQNSLISDPTDKDFITPIKIHWYNLFKKKKGFKINREKIYFI